MGNWCSCLVVGDTEIIWREGNHLWLYFFVQMEILLLENFHIQDSIKSNIHLQATIF